MPGSSKFCQRGSNFDNNFLVDDGREDPSTTLSGPSSARQRNAIKWRFAGVPMIGPIFNAGFVAALFQGMRTFIARKPLYICDFSGRGPEPLSPPPSGSAHAINIY